MGFHAAGGPRTCGITVYPEDYGALRDGSHDDTQAIRDAITAAVSAGQTNGSHCATVQFTPGTYLCSSATSTSGSGNSQIQLPVISRTTSPKFTLIFKGVDDVSATPIWSQTVNQNTGVVIRSTLAGQTFDATNGCPSIIGGPTPERGFSALNYSNMLVVIDGLSVIAPLDPTVHGVDLSGVAMAYVRSLRTSTNANPSTFTLPGAGFWSGTSKFACGLVMPDVGNNLYSRIDSYGSYNWCCGLCVGEHLVAQRLWSIYCRVGLTMFTNSPNGVSIQALSTELCRTHIYLDPIISGGSACQISIGMWEIEDGAGGIGGVGTFDTASHLTDSGNIMRGDINVQNFITGSLAITGATKARIKDILRVPGTVTAPSVPASTTALLNPFWRDAAVSVAGGTVTAITVDGVATGLTSGTVIVPSGKTIALTYSVAPAWKWTLL
jgi:hypothetical protein